MSVRLPRLKGKVSSINKNEQNGFIKDKHGREFFFHENYTIPHPPEMPELGDLVEFTPRPRGNGSTDYFADDVLVLRERL